MILMSFFLIKKLFLSVGANLEDIYFFYKILSYGYKLKYKAISRYRSYLKQSLF